MTTRYAEDQPYWDTTVHPAKSLGEIQELLEDFGVTNTLVTQVVSALPGIELPALDNGIIEGEVKE